MFCMGLSGTIKVLWETHVSVHEQIVLMCNALDASSLDASSLDASSLNHISYCCLILSAQVS